MKVYRMPTALILSALSWLVAISGALGYIYIIIYKNEVKYLLVAPLILLVSLILSALIRTFGNIGQMIFDLRLDIQRLNGILSNSLKGLNDELINLSAYTKETKEALSNGFLSLNQELKTQLQNQTAGIIKGLQDLNHHLSAGLDHLSISLKETLKESQDLVGKGLLNLAQEMNSFQELSRKFSEKLQNLNNCIEQINCDAKDINQNINQIKTFFEQIERHLDLKK